MAPLIHRILLATDGSAYAARAEEYALFLASAWEAGLDMLSVLEFPPGMNPEYPINDAYLGQLRKEADRHLERLADRASQVGLSVKKQVVIGIPSQKITAIARDNGDDLVVVGTHGRTGLEHVLLGSTAERVIRGAPCPVLAVRGRKPGSAQVPDHSSPIAVRRMLVPIDFSDCSLDALEYAVQVAKHVNAAITILHVMEPVAYGLDFTLSHPSELEAKRARPRRSASGTWSRRTAGWGLQADEALRGGLPADSILDYARSRAVDLIVMGTHGRRGISHLVNGSVTEAVAAAGGLPGLDSAESEIRPGSSTGRAENRVGSEG
ncbi:MAG: universal stress protein [Nitrospiraceae bacterium]|nr:MAG: universal stress protein [Nitrospiraceae bacterium]